MFARALPLLAAAGAALAIAGCGSAGTARGLDVVAAESFWGSIAAQLAGPKAHTASIIVNPAQDPHAYEPTVADARRLADARLIIVNGLGYDRWASQLLGADSGAGQVTLDVGRLLGVQPGSNPHRWYDPADVDAVAGAITAALRRIDPADAAYFEARGTAFAQHALAAYRAQISYIRRHYAGVPVGASESIFALQAPALGLRLITPPQLMKAISEGTEAAANDLLRAQRQLSSRRVRVWVFNRQNDTPQVAQLTGLARAARIPTVPVTETLTPRGASFQTWQLAQLRRLAAALHEATGR